MSDTSGPTSGTPFAQYDPIESCWKTCEATSLWALTLSSLTLPTWGALRDGVLYELPTWERPTSERDSLSSLATPTAWLGGRPVHAVGDPDRWSDPARSNELSDQIAAILPTPTAQAAKHMTMDDRGEGTVDDHNLWSVARRLLPTPAVNDMGAGKDPQAWQEWAARQKAADGTPAPHGKSLEQEALKMLPTPLAEMGNVQRQDFTPNLRTVIEGNAMLIGATTPPPSPDGNTSLDDPHQPPLFADESETA